MFIDLTGIELKIPVFASSLPCSVYYPYVLTHVNSIDREYRYMIKARLIILDINVHRFTRIGDYPIRELARYYYTARSLARRLGERLIIVLPDLPWDDYFRGTRYIDNIRRTYTYHYALISRIVEICRKYGSKMMPVIQHRHSLDTVTRSSLYVLDIAERYRDYIYGIGIGSLCVSRSIRKIVNIVNTVRWVLGYDYRLHLFGVSIRVLDHVKDRISIDSTGWTRPVDEATWRTVEGKRRSCTSERARTVYFLLWIRKILEKLGQDVDIVDKYINMIIKRF
ncbi:MAG: hypothetical protein GXO26_08380 [Crenarchaeota archaeon]|nr:hypothetical protein [Thermoproteota archaeon]